MELSRTERWILSNQYRILEIVDPDDAEYYAKVRKAIEEGYASAIEAHAEYIYRDDHTLSREQCGEVTDILSMYEALQRAVQEDNLPEGIDAGHVRFPGFDGNSETPLLGYARYVVDKEGRFSYLDRTPDLNSHSPSIDIYRRMLDVWIDQTDRSYELTPGRVQLIMDARVHPSNR